jgi:hypothetical protein
MCAKQEIHVTCEQFFVSRYEDLQGFQSAMSMDGRQARCCTIVQTGDSCYNLA